MRRRCASLKTTKWSTHYHPGTGVGSVVIGTIYALVDGFIGGAIFGWLYNRLVGE